MARALVRSLVAGHEETDRIELLTAAGSDALGGLGVGIGTQDRIRVTQAVRHEGPRHFAWDLPVWLRRLTPRPDLVLCLTHAPLGNPVPVALMVPDLSFEHLPDAFPRLTRLRLQTLVRRQTSKVDRVLTISEFCRADLIATYGLDPLRVHHVPLHVDLPGASHDVGDMRRRLGVAGPFVLYLGNLHPRKNLPIAIAAFHRAVADHAELRHHGFVVAGAPWWGSRDHRTDIDLTAVRFLGRVSDDDRDALLSAADVLVYPSRFEGFGLPPLEAFARGTPVVASNVTAIPEICGDAALMVDPDDEVAMAKAIVAAVNDKVVRRSLIEAGYRRAAHYNDGLTTAALWEALRATTRPAMATTA